MNPGDRINRVQDSMVVDLCRDSRSVLTRAVQGAKCLVRNLEIWFQFRDSNGMEKSK